MTESVSSQGRQSGFQFSENFTCTDLAAIGKQSQAAAPPISLARFILKGKMEFVP